MTPPLTRRRLLTRARRSRRRWPPRAVPHPQRTSTLTSSAPQLWPTSALRLLLRLSPVQPSAVQLSPLQLSLLLLLLVLLPLLPLARRCRARQPRPLHAALPLLLPLRLLRLLVLLLRLLSRAPPQQLAPRQLPLLTVTVQLQLPLSRWRASSWPSLRLIALAALLRPSRPRRLQLPHRRSVGPPLPLLALSLPLLLLCLPLSLPWPPLRCPR